MAVRRICIVIIVCCHVGAVHYPNAGSDVSEEEIVQPKPKPETSQQQEIEKEAETDKSEIEKIDDKSALQEALNIVLNPEKTVQTNDEDSIGVLLDTISADNQTLDRFMQSMDNLSEDICKRAQDALWVYVNDMNNEEKKKTMMMTSRQEDEVKWRYWSMLKTKYLSSSPADPGLDRKIRTIKERGINILNPNSQEKDIIKSMQRTWNSALVCPYNASCAPHQVKTVSERRRQSIVPYSEVPGGVEGHERGVQSSVDE